MIDDLKKHKILITGASGSLGRQLVYEFDQRDIKPIVHIRKTSDSSYIDALGLEKRYADLRHNEELDNLVKDIDLIIHTAAWVNFRQDRLTQFTGINTFGALNLYKAASKAKVKRFLHISSVAAIGGISHKEYSKKSDIDDKILANEESPYNVSQLRIPYFMTKKAAEDELLKESKNSETELVIVNPSIILSPGDDGDDRTRANRIFKRFVVPDLTVDINMVDIRDLTPGIISALEKGRNRERYIMGGDNLSARDFVLNVSANLGIMPHVTRLPRPVYNISARFYVFFKKLFGRGKISYYPDLVKLLDYDWIYSSAKARKELNYRNRSIHTTLQDLLNNNFTGTYMKDMQGNSH